MLGGRYPPAPPGPPATSESPADPFARLSFQPASQAHILRAHQRDASQVHRLVELVSELIRSIAGTRWLAHKQTAVDLIVRATYLVLTLGRGAQTLGEEYTDITPYATTRRNFPSRRRRLLTIIFILLPSIVTSPSASSYLHSSAEDDAPWSRMKRSLARFAESPIGQALPELHMMAFLFRGRFYELGRRLTGVSYVSMLPARPPEQQHPSFEPLAMLMLLPLLRRLWPRPLEQGTTPTTSISTLASPSAHPSLYHPVLPLSPPLTPPLTAEETIILTKSTTYDVPNTYLTPEALALPERQCTLCLEPRGTGEGSGGTVAVTECGHVFCWGCLGGLEKPECPLCRQALRMERLVAAYNL
ncbi:peroxisome bioproteinsis factor 10 [Saitozyma podzolica]|uniref:RING-type E3 ubiquitin transferase n=1 Tax=Saitozyma podzolica TaxID=1890683 RepID=A0A427YTD8_9TREE|nr:peroxisome bioproteinsis factor 10 [Saitozyma podzolica]